MAKRKCMAGVMASVMFILLLIGIGINVHAVINPNSVYCSSVFPGNCPNGSCREASPSWYATGCKIYGCDFMFTILDCRP